MRIPPPQFDYPIITSEGRPSEVFSDFLYDMWFRTGQEAGIAGFSLLSDTIYTQIFEDTQGNTYLTNNAVYNVSEGYWERIDETRTSWMLVMLGVSEPLEEALGLPAQTAGTWIAQPSVVGGVANPAFTAEVPRKKIKDGFTGAAGGWERGTSTTQFGDFVVRGYGIELDANGIVPFSRAVGGFAPGAGTYGWFGTIYNVYLDHSGTDRAKISNAAAVLRTTATDGEPYDWVVTFADETDASADDDEVGTTAPDFDEIAASIRRVTGSVNYLSFLPSVTTDPILMQATGTDTNIDIELQPKGSGSVSVRGGGTNAYLNVHDATTTAGNVGVGAQGNTLILKSGNIFAATFNAAGAVSLAQASTAASVAADFDADYYMPITLNGATRYIPLMASTW